VDQLLDAVAEILQRLAPASEFIAGIATGIIVSLAIVFVKRSQERRTARQSVATELTQIEYRLMGLTATLLWGEEPTDREIVELKKWVHAGLPYAETVTMSDAFRGITALSVEVIRGIMSGGQRGEGLLVPYVRSPLLNELLAKPSHYFTADETQALAAVAWQLQHLDNETRRMEEWCRDTIRLEGEQRDDARKNYEHARQFHRERLPIALDFVRRAQKALAD